LGAAKLVWPSIHIKDRGIHNAGDSIGEVDGPLAKQMNRKYTDKSVG
jgi:hypothetical protein